MKTVAVIGASNDRSRFGNKAVRAFQQQGWEVFPVSLSDPKVEGLTAYKSISDLPVRPKWTTIYVRPTILEGLLPAIAERGCDELWLNPGTVSPKVLEEAKRLNLKTIQGCSILAIGASPSAF
jgi:predicted CoA-binding protein